MDAIEVFASPWTVWGNQPCRAWLYDKPMTNPTKMVNGFTSDILTPGTSGTVSHIANSLLLSSIWSSPTIRTTTPQCAVL